MRVAAVVFLGSSLIAGAALTPTRLRCEYRDNPMGTDEPLPRLEWVNRAADGERGQVQTAWQVQVFQQRGGAPGGRCVWESGRVASAESTQVAYGGEPLLPCSRYLWRVRVWDRDGRPSPWSSTAFFETGYLGNPWPAEWIGAPWQSEDGKVDADAAPLLRKSFVIPSEVVQARAYVTGVGYYELCLNGRKVGDDVLTPAQTDYGPREHIVVGHPIEPRFSGHRVLYQTYDVTGLLRLGENVAGAMLGNGWYNRNDGREGQLGYGAPRFLLVLRVLLADGSTREIASDGSWRAAQGPVTFNRIYAGEHYDARLERTGWNAPGFDDGAWQAAQVRRPPGGLLQAQCAPTDRVMEVVRPRSIVKLGEGRYRLSFPEEISGWLRFRVSGQAGQKVEVRWLAQDTDAKQDYNGKNSYTLKGGGDETYAPRFTWFVFKDVELNGWPGELTMDRVQAEAVYTGVETTGRFACSNPLFEKIQRLYWRSQTDNLHGALSSDCPHRERLGYTGDGQASCVAAIHTFDLAAFYTKWVQDYFDAQNPTSGYVTDTAPFEGGGGGPAWGSACIIVPWQAYLHYGDRRLLERHYAGMKHYLGWMYSLAQTNGTLFCKLPNGKDTYWLNLGDWCAPDKKLPPRDLVHTFYLWYCTDLLGRIADALGQEGDACTYRALAATSAAAFHAAYYDRAKGSYGPVGGDVFALRMGVPAERRDRVREALAAGLEANGGHLDTGIFGTGFLFEALCEYGLGELAYRLMDKRTYPSYGWWVEQGWTTTGEYWEGQGSRNHPMFGGGLSWLYRQLAGFGSDESAPGYRQIVIRPRPVGGLTRASYSTRTPYGEASVEWARTAGAFELTAEVPVGSVARIVLPAAADARITECGKPLAEAIGVRTVGLGEAAAVVDVGSGTYRFAVRR